MTPEPASAPPRRLVDLPTPCLVLDRGKLGQNLAAMAQAVARHGVALRPHMKTAKSAAVARLAVAGQAGGITVSTLAEVEYFAAAGFRDILYAVGITAAKLDRAAALRQGAVDLKLVTDDPETAAAIAAHARTTGAEHRVLVEIDCGEHRGGMAAESETLLAVGRALGPLCAGVMTHAGHSYACRSIAEIEAVAEAERLAAVTAAARLRALGLAIEIVSVGSTPTALHARNLAGVSETRPGVYMFQDLFQTQIFSGSPESMAVTVLASVIHRRQGENRIVIDAGAMALSKDRSTAAVPKDFGFGLVLDAAGHPSLGEAIVERANQEHGIIAAATPLPFDRLPVGTRLRVAPNHVCMTAAAYDRYHVVDGGDEVLAVWERINGW
ncbi:MAG TPA: alanine racemase [Stellaceae bacterium]|jgi:D-serine deaminase-like pyridoxal phosphate-dependent protein|nr:alanine racemase [Stellaceae bacterium]